VLLWDVLENADDVTFAQAKRSECRAFQDWKKGLIDFVTLEGGSIARAIIHVTPSIEEEIKPIRWGFSCWRRAGRSGRWWRASANDWQYWQGKIIIFRRGGPGAVFPFEVLDVNEIVWWHLLHRHFDNDAVDFVQSQLVLIGGAQVLRINSELPRAIVPGSHFRFVGVLRWTGFVQGANHDQLLCSSNKTNLHVGRKPEGGLDPDRDVGRLFDDWVVIGG
jgi:hypothetical protein